MPMLMKKWFLLVSAIALITVAIVHKNTRGGGPTVEVNSPAPITMDEGVSVPESQLPDTPLLTSSSAESNRSSLRDPLRTGNIQRGGFVLSCNYWEELTSATRNLASLQCWAGRLNMSVVEPLVKDTSLSFPFRTTKKGTDSLHWRDVYDIDHWNDQQRKGYAALTSWKSFLTEAPRSLIVVNVQYSEAAPRKGAQHGKGCRTQTSLTDAVKLLQKFHFKVARQVCIDFALYKDLSTDEFYDEIFGDLKPSMSTVLFSQWRGVGAGRLRVRNSDCAITSEFLDDIVPSKRMLRDAESYVEKYLKMNDYVAIMVRLQKVTKITSNVTRCFQQSLQTWNRMVKDSGINVTFLSADVSRFGSAIFRRTGKEDMYDAFSRFFSAIYSNHFTTGEWESTFERTSAHPGYVGVLQKVIASRAKCVLFMGGGSFQYHALRLHQKMYPSNHCVYIVKECTHERMYSFLAQPEQTTASYS